MMSYSTNTVVVVVEIPVVAIEFRPVVQIPDPQKAKPCSSFAFNFTATSFLLWLYFIAVNKISYSTNKRACSPTLLHVDFWSIWTKF